MKVNISIVKAFTKDPEEGNPAGVVWPADNLTSRQMQKVATELNFSESAFITKSDKADFRVRFFTPVEEVNLCAHAVIASFYLISQKVFENTKMSKLSYTQETNAGILKVLCHNDGLIEMEQTEAEINSYIHDRKKIAKMLGITDGDLLNLPITTISTGKLKIMIPIKSLKVLNRIKPDLEALKQYSIDSKSNGFYAFTLETKSSDSDFHTRQFNPLYGINEDPATGIAAAPLAIYAKINGIKNKNKFVIEQGDIMNRPSKIFVDLNQGVKVGGYAVLQKEITLNIS